MKLKEDPPIVIIGGGGHSSTLAEILLMNKRKIIAVVSPRPINNRPVFYGIPHLKSDLEITCYNPNDVKLVNGIGMLPRTTTKHDVNEYFLKLGYKFESVISPDALISPHAVIKDGVQILTGAVIQNGATIGEHSIINSGVLVEHDCKIGRYNHIAPRATLCGQVTTKDNVYIGAGATVIQNLSIGFEAIIGAGTCITKSVEERMVVRPANVEYQLLATNKGPKR